LKKRIFVIARYGQALPECGITRLPISRLTLGESNIIWLFLPGLTLSCQLFYYSKALVSVVPFSNARESIMLLFSPFLEDSEIASQRYPLVESALVKAHGILFTHGTISDYVSLMDQFCSVLDNHIGRVTAKFRVQGPEIASSLCAATFDFGNAKAYVEAYQSSHGQEEPPPEDLKAKYAS
jgi:hypothetical protein